MLITSFQLIFRLHNLPRLSGCNDGIRSVSKLQLLAGNLSQFLVFVILKDVPRVVITDVSNEVIPMFVVELGRDSHEAFVDVCDPSE